MMLKILVIFWFSNLYSYVYAYPVNNDDIMNMRFHGIGSKRKTHELSSFSSLSPTTDLDNKQVKLTLSPSPLKIMNSFTSSTTVVNGISGTGMYGSKSNHDLEENYSSSTSYQPPLQQRPPIISGEFNMQRQLLHSIAVGKKLFGLLNSLVNPLKEPTQPWKILQNALIKLRQIRNLPPLSLTNPEILNPAADMHSKIHSLDFWISEIRKLYPSLSPTSHQYIVMQYAYNELMIASLTPPQPVNEEDDPLKVAEATNKFEKIRRLVGSSKSEPPVSVIRKTVNQICKIRELPMKDCLIVGYTPTKFRESERVTEMDFWTNELFQLYEQDMGGSLNALLSKAIGELETFGAEGDMNENWLKNFDFEKEFASDDFDMRKSGIF